MKYILFLALAVALGACANHPHGTRWERKYMKRYPRPDAYPGQTFKFRDDKVHKI